MTAWWAGQELFRDLWLIAFGLLVMSAVPIMTDIAVEHVLVMGAAMIVAVAVPYLVSRHGYRRPRHPLSDRHRQALVAR